MLPVASTRSRRFPESYCATWIETVSAATVAVLVAVGGTAVTVDVGSTEVAVGTAFVEVGCIGVNVAITLVEVGAGCVAVSVRVGVGAVTCVITNERTVDHAPFVPPDVRPRTRHQNVRSLVNV